MANTSILNAFERMWQHIVVALSGKSDKEHSHDIADVSNLETTLNDIEASVNDKVSVDALSDYVPTTRTVNGKALSSNVTLSASDVGARPDTWIPTAEEVGALSKWARSADHDDADSIFANGLYYASYNTPDNTFCIIECVEGVYQRAYKYQSASGDYDIYYRSYFSDGGYWKHDWEWVNPPMEYGVEYRTTERYKGYPVYTVTLNFGYTRDAGYYSVTAPNVEIEYPDFTVIDVSAVCLDAESSKEIGCYYNATQFFEHISVSTVNSPLTVWAKRNEYFDYNGVIFNTSVTIKYVRADLDSAYANA